MNYFKNSMILITGSVSIVFMLVVSALFFVPEWGSVGTALASEEMRYALGMSVMTGVVSTVITMIIAIPVAYTFSRYDFPFKRLAKTVFYLPIALPEIVLGLCLLLFFGSVPIRSFFETFGISFIFTKTGIIVAQFFAALPYVVRVVKTAFDGVDPKLELVSRSLGCSQLRTFFSLTIPMSRKRLLAATAIAFSRCVGAFGTVLILTGGTRMETETLTIALYLNMSYGNLDMAVSAGLLLVVVAFLAIFFVEATNGYLSNHRRAM